MRSAALVIALAAIGCARHAADLARRDALAATCHPVCLGPGIAGAIVGRLSDERGKPMVGAVVVVGDSPQSRGVSNDAGAFDVRGVSTGTHDVTLYFNDLTYDFGQVATGTRIDAMLVASHPKAHETIRIGPPPPISVAKVAQGITIESNWLHNVPFGR